MADMIELARREINKAFGRATNLIRRGIITLCSDSYFCQMEGNDGEIFDDAEYWQSFGFASRPPVDGEVLFANLGGHAEHAIAFASNDRAHRPSSLSEGDSVHYASTSGGNQSRAHAKADGNYDIVPGSGTVNIGGNSTACVDYLLKGTTFDTANRSMLDLISSAFTAIGGAVPAASAACSAAVAGITAFKAGNYVATKGKVL